MVSPRIAQKSGDKSSKKGPGVRVQRNVNSALQSSSNDPILQLLNKDPDSSFKQGNMPLQLDQKKSARDESPIIGGGAGAPSSGRRNYQ